MNVLEKILEEVDNMEMIHVNYRRDTFRDGFSSGSKKCCEIIRSHMSEIEKVTSAEIISRNIDGKPYYEIKYKKVGEDHYTVGYSSYKLDYVVNWMNEYLEFCGEAKVSISEGKDTNVPSNWISVEERLPEAGELVKVTVHSSEWISNYNSDWVSEEDKIHYPAEYNVYDGFLCRNEAWIFYDKYNAEVTCVKEFGIDKGRVYDVVTAWMPIKLPEPYKGE